MGLDPENKLALLSSEGPIAQSLSAYEERAEQKQMLETVFKSQDQASIALIEAGTGVGKSLAYLLPALHIAHTEGHITVVSTHTITLQEQLMQKDLPFLSKTLGLDIPVALVKGMGNYLCLRKLYDLVDQASLLNVTEREQLKELESWVEKTDDGSSSDLNKTYDKITWDKVHCESSACSFVKCQHYKECFFFKARKKVKDAKVLVVNHHLLMVDMQAKELEDKGAILPEYDHLVIDEAHTLEDIATSALAQNCSLQGITRKLHELVSDRTSLGKMQRLKHKLTPMQDVLKDSLWNKVSFEVFSEKKEVETTLLDAFYDLEDFLKATHPSNDLSNERIELGDLLRSHPSWQNLQVSFEKLEERLLSLSSTLSVMIQQIESTDRDIQKKVESLLVDIKALSSFYERSALLLKEFFKGKAHPSKLYVIEKTERKTYHNIQLNVIELNIAKILAENLFSPPLSTVLCSATLNHKGKFDFVKKQLGLRAPYFKKERFLETILPSPFNYKEQALLAAPNNLPMPTAPDYLEAVCSQIQSALAASQGGAFVLFTSFKMLGQCYERLLPFMLDKKLLPLKQGDENRTLLLNLFKKEKNGVLFGTDTFWEGIDVPGESLRLVILTKLPFPVPTEPLFKARCTQIEKEGGNSFMDYSIPKALIKFKQGFGRLIRSQKDRGCILCLDSRLVTKRYGNLFIQDLPTCKTSFGPSRDLEKQISLFFNQSS